MNIQEMIEDFKNLKNELGDVDLIDDSLEAELDKKMDVTLTKMNPEDLQNFAREVHKGLDNLGVGIGFSMHRIFEERLKSDLSAKNYSDITEAIDNNDTEVIKSFIKSLLKALLTI